MRKNLLLIAIMIFLILTVGCISNMNNKKEKKINNESSFEVEEKEQVRKIKELGEEELLDYFKNKISSNTYYQKYIITSLSSNISNNKLEEERARYEISKVYVEYQVDDLIFIYKESYESEDSYLKKVNNKENYKYKISSVKKSSNDGVDSIDVKLTSNTNDNKVPKEINLIYLEDKEFFRFEIGRFIYYAYYDMEDAEISAKEETNSKNENIKQYSKPRVGMTENEVLKTRWGEPKRKNIDTYSNRVKEQWVYDRGYVYFENGVVTCVSER